MNERHLLSSVVALGVLGMAHCERASAGFIVTSWSLHSEVDDFHSGQNQIRFFDTILNPLILHQSVAVPPNSMGTTDYDFGWDDFGGSFQITAEHSALDVPPGGLFSRSTGLITIQTTQDLHVSVTGFYNYALPPQLFTADLWASVGNLDTSQMLWGQDPSADSFGGSFVSGTLHVDTPTGGVLLPASDHLYTLSYTFLLRTFGGGTNAIGTGNGEIHWTLQVVPECTAVSFFTLTSLLLMRRRHS